MYPFILKLIEIFKQKKRSFEELKGYVQDVRKIINDLAVAYTAEEQNKILKRHIFHEDTGLLPLVNSLIDLNNELVHYRDEDDETSIRDEHGINMSKNLAHCGLEVHRAYRGMMSYVEKEQYILVKLFLPILEEMAKKRDPRKAWESNLGQFKNLLLILHFDIEQFYKLLNILRERGFITQTDKVKNKNKEAVKNNIIISLKSGHYTDARYWLSHAMNNNLFSKEEFKDIKSLIDSVENKDWNSFEDLIENSTLMNLFGKEEIESLIGERINIPANYPDAIIERLKEEKKELKKIRKRAKKVRIPKNILSEISEKIGEVDDTIKAIRRSKGKIADIRNYELSLMILKGSVELRRKFEYIIKNARKSRRGFIKTLGKAAVGTAAAGSILHKVISKEPKPLAPKGSANVVKRELEIPEVNKTIHTEGNYANAKYYVVIPHSSELDALLAARRVAQGPITWVGGNGDRNLKITVNSTTFSIDPNRVFWEQGTIENFEFLNGPWHSLTREEQEEFMEKTRRFTSEINKRIFPPQSKRMILALHQNTEDNFDIHYYRDIPNYAKHVEEVHINEEEDPDVLAFVTTRGWFEALKSRNWNVVLQKNEMEVNDGSISYTAWRKGVPYVNIEVERKGHKRQEKMIRGVNELIDQHPQLATDTNYVPPIGSIKKGKVYLTIDDGPSPYTKDILNYLEEKDVKAVFFCRGDKIEMFEDAALEIVKRGFVLGNHSYNHQQFSKISKEEGRRQIERTDKIIDNIYGKVGVKREFRFFRFPYGDHGGENRRHYYGILNSMGYKIWYWHKDIKDYDQPSVEEALRGLEDLESGDIILLHDIEYTYETLLRPIIKRLLERGFYTALPKNSFEFIPASLG